MLEEIIFLLCYEPLDVTSDGLHEQMTWGIFYIEMAFLQYVFLHASWD